jgi:integrase
MKLKCFRKPSGLIMLQISDPKFTKRFYYSTGEYSTLQEWNPTSGFTKDASALNDRLMALMKKANDYVLLNRHNFSREGLRQALDGTAPNESVDNRRSLSDEWKDYLTTIKGSVNLQSQRNYEKSKETFEEFLKTKGFVHILPDQFTFRHYQMYQVFLKEKYAPNTVSKKTKHFKMFINYLGKLKIALAMDTDEITFREYAGVKISLRDDELKAIETLNLVGLISDARDLFLLQCLTGLRISDLFRLDKNIRNGMIHLETQKVQGNVVEIPITPRV